MALRSLAPQQSLVDQVYEAILGEITEGKFGPEDRLIQEEIAESLGVSRQPVQQALLLLRSHGLLCDAPGRGLMVTPLEADRVRNLYELRAVLDGLATANAAHRGADAVRDEGPAVIARGRAAVRSRSIARMIAADMEFHFLLYRLSGNPLIAEVSGPHWSYLRRVMGEVLMRGTTPDDIWNEHAAILDEVMAGRASAAEKLARAHIAGASDVLTTRMTEIPAAAAEAPSPRKRAARRVR